MDRWISPPVLIPVILVTVLVYRYLSAVTRRLPPGPPRLPFIGNAHQVPKKTPYITFTEWKKSYGDLIHLDLIGQPTLIVNTWKIANDLMDKRSTIYSDRPVTEMIKLSGFTETITLQQYGDTLKQQRRMVAPDFAQSYVHNYSPFQERQMALLVHNALENPQALAAELKLRIGKLILRTTHGYNAQTVDDDFLKIGLAAVENFSKITTPGAFLVDLVPVLKYLPRWCPGTASLSFAEDSTGGVFQPNLMSNISHNAGGSLNAQDEHQAAWVGLTMFGAGLDTKISTILTFLMCMILNPDVQKKAQAEIDVVIGKDRLPLITDRDRLPYVRSVLTETFRWAPTLPLGVPHVLSKDDIYDGYFLPQGTVLLPNTWGMLHDPEIYPDPMAFKPERFNGDDASMEKVNIVFGFGRRICPGRHFAEGTIFTALTTFLATCDILPGLNEAGEEVMPDPTYTSGTIILPQEFPIRLKARSSQAASLLVEACNAFEG